jgi:multidrug transporter EmrE-like cation transporter
MNSTQIVGLVLIVAGLLGLAYGGFSYTKTTDQAQLGPITLSVTDRQSVNVPAWAGVGSIVVGALLLAAGRRRG